MTARLTKLVEDLIEDIDSDQLAKVHTLLPEIQRELKLTRRSTAKPAVWQKGRESATAWMKDASERLASQDFPPQQEIFEALQVAYQRGRGQGATEHFRPVSLEASDIPYTKPAVDIWERAFIAALGSLAATSFSPAEIAESAALIADHAGGEWRERCGGPFD